ncbi:MAG: hypothetical protein LBR19_02225 [Bifidobacteriaceae bacterium]|nr:hypothetical protein [Bifidobacteriaceae bacterium]
MAALGLALALAATASLASCSADKRGDQATQAPSGSGAAVPPYYLLAANLIPDVTTAESGAVGGNRAFFEADEAIAAMADHLMQRLEQQQGAILMNWMNLGVPGPGPERLFEVNDADGFYGDYAAAARPTHSVTVNRNYLALAGITTADGSPVVDRLADAPGTLNVVAPAALKALEADLLAAYQEYAWERLVQVPNIYNEELGRPLDGRQPADFTVNLIWAQDGQAYATYQSIYHEMTGETAIIDPVAVVYSHQFHGSDAVAALTQYLCLPGVAGAPDDPDALWDAIGPLVEQVGLGGRVFGVLSVTDPAVQSAGVEGGGEGGGDGGGDGGASDNGAGGTSFSVGTGEGAGDGPEDQSGTVP